MSAAGDLRTIALAIVVVFGAPATGKTTLLKGLKKEPAHGSFYYTTIDEPTHAPHIVALLRQMYTETDEAVRAGLSVATQVQNEIMEERARLYNKFTESCPPDIWRALRANAGTLVVVCDGHLLTDDKLYVASKVASGQISADQLAVYEKRKEELVHELHAAFARPLGFVELALVDKTGETHVRRIAQRDSVAEAGLPPAVFARLAQYSEKTRTTLEREGFATERIFADSTDPSGVISQFQELVEKKLARAVQSLAAVFQMPPPEVEIAA